MSRTGEPSGASSSARVRVSRGKARAPDRAVFDRAIAEFFMRAALQEAAKGLGRTHPNPVVGAVLVKNGKILAKGFHKKAGTSHAEVIALERAGARAKGADLYTTLEPCDHFGRTPPCSQAILESGVRRLFVASSDPNPLVNGKGLARLRAAGVEILEGVLREEADRLNAPFFRAMQTGLPYVTLKAAMTLDGKIATATGDSRWVTGPEARAWVHRLRDRVDAILVGANTVRLDDPQLTTRLESGEGRDAARVVIDSRLELPLSRKLFTQRTPARTIVATLASPESAKARRLEKQGVEVWQVKPARGATSAPARVDVRAVLRRLVKEGMNHVLCEGGAQLSASLLTAGLVQELLLFVAPKLVGGSGLTWTGALPVRQMRDALTTGPLSVSQLGPDLLVVTHPDAPGRRKR